MAFGDTRTFTSLADKPLPFVVIRTDGGVLALASARCLAVLDGVKGVADSAEDTTVDVELEALSADVDVVDEALMNRGARSSCRPSKTTMQSEAHWNLIIPAPPTAALTSNNARLEMVECCCMLVQECQHSRDCGGQSNDPAGEQSHSKAQVRHLKQDIRPQHSVCERTCSQRSRFGSDQPCIAVPEYLRVLRSSTSSTAVPLNVSHAQPGEAMPLSLDAETNHKAVSARTFTSTRSS